MTSTNMRTRAEWLHAILYSGEVTKIGQHLALVIYHLSDPETNTAKLSARDLERVTGWSRPAIVDHLSELEIFIRVTWGAGRAKSLFELQGVITEVLQGRNATTVTGTPTETGNGSEAAAVAAATVPVAQATVSEPAAIVTASPFCGSQVTTKSEMGGTIGGENNNYPSKYLSHSPVPTQAPDWTISEDGGFEGQIFELTGADFAGLQQIYEHLEWPAEMVAADYFFAREFGNAGVTPLARDRMGRLHTYLAKKNRDVRELRLTLRKLNTDKPVRKAAEPIVPAEPLSCWFDGEARLQVANGFKTDLLAAVGNDELRLRTELDKAAGYVGVNTRGPQLMAKVRSRVISQTAEKHDKDERYSKASTSKRTDQSGESQRDRIARYIREAQAKKEARPS